MSCLRHIKRHYVYIRIIGNSCYIVISVFLQLLLSLRTSFSLLQFGVSFVSFWRTKFKDLIFDWILSINTPLCTQVYASVSQCDDILSSLMTYIFVFDPRSIYPSLSISLPPSVRPLILLFIHSLVYLFIPPLVNQFSPRFLY